MVRGVLVGASQILALLPGISRSGVAMVAGLTQGLSHRDAARFSFLLATPVILAAGVLKIPGSDRAVGRRASAGRSWSAAPPRSSAPTCRSGSWNGTSGPGR